jgi:hypothetical protein
MATKTRKATPAMVTTTTAAESRTSINPIPASASATSLAVRRL